MNSKKNSLLIFVKAIDGGTGSYVLDLYKLKKRSFIKEINIISLEKPQFRFIDKKIKIIYFREKNFSTNFKS